MNIVEKKLFEIWEDLKSCLDTYIKEKHVGDNAVVIHTKMYIPRAITSYRVEKYKGTLLVTLSDLVKEGDDLLLYGQIRFEPFMDNYGGCALPHMNRIDILNHKEDRGKPRIKLDKYQLHMLSKCLTDGKFIELLCSIEYTDPHNNRRRTSISLIKEVDFNVAAEYNDITLLEDKGWVVRGKNKKGDK